MNKYACVVAMMAVGMLAACAMSPNHPSHAAAGATGDVIAPLSLVPAVARLDRQAGSFALREGTRIVAPAGDEGAHRVAQYLADRIKRSTGMQLTVADGGDAKGAIVLASDPAIEGEEAYALDVTSDGATIRASTSGSPAMTPGKFIISATPSARGCRNTARISSGPNGPTGDSKSDAGTHDGAITNTSSGSPPSDAFASSRIRSTSPPSQATAASFAGSSIAARSPSTLIGLR